MNRDIKFRVWDNEGSVWIDPSHLQVNPDGFLYLPYGIAPQRNVKRFQIQQFTGLRDKNGVNIYEGDIIKINKLYYEVMWVEYKWIATCPNYRRYNWPTLEHFNEVRCGEVAGNVFENPNLLK